MDLQTYLQDNYSHTSINGYYNMIQRYLLAMGKKADKAGYKDIVSYIGLLRAQGLHPKSLRNNLLIYYSYLLAIGKRNDHPCRYLNLKDRINRQIQIESLYSKQTLDDLYTNWKSHTALYLHRDKIIVSLLIYQALTAQEIINLKVRDIDPDSGKIHIKATAKNKGRILSLKSNQILLFMHYLQDRKKIVQANNTTYTTPITSPIEPGNAHLLLNRYAKPLWVGAVNRIINQGRDVKDKLIPLKIRQSVIAHLLKEGNDTRIVQEFAGHRRTGSTENYKQSGLDELKAVIDKLHPLQ
jgi:integrase/recombinase XerD